MSGQWGSTILEFVITFAVVLVLVAVVYWLVRRYSGHGLGRIGRGRVPRLAVIDAMAVDGRRRLILVHQNQPSAAVHCHRIYDRQARHATAADPSQTVSGITPNEPIDDGHQHQHDRECDDA